RGASARRDLSALPDPDQAEIPRGHGDRRRVLRDGRVARGQGPRAAASRSAHPMMTFADVYGAEPEALGEAPGRVNLLGEHTDYNEGYVLPAAIPQRTRVELRRSAGGTCDLYSANLDRRARFTLDHPPADPFARYAYGCMRALADGGIDLPPLEMRVASTVPIGAGLSSSAALEIATLRAVRKLLDLDIDDVRVARIAHRAENEYVGVRCGI